jgi:large conductance mechanosensitive channel protein
MLYWQKVIRYKYMPTPKEILAPAADKAVQTAEKAADTAANKIEVKAHVKSGKMKGRKVTVLLDADDLVKEQVGGFVNFVREHAIVGLAIGFIIGQQAQGAIKQLVDSFITPLLELVIGGSLKTTSFFIGKSEFKYGLFIYVLINLIFVLLTIYALIKFLKLDKLDKPKEKTSEKVAEKPADKTEKATKK